MNTETELFPTATDTRTVCAKGFITLRAAAVNEEQHYGAEGRYCEGLRSMINAGFIVRISPHKYRGTIIDLGEKEFHCYEDYDYVVQLITEATRND